MIEYICEIGDGILPIQELIRCKDCKWYTEKEWIVGGGSYIMCRNGSIANAKPTDYCSRAERKDDEID